jgi:hypothetical protein
MMQRQHEEHPHARPSLRLFYCYAREDQALRDELDKHLASLRRRSLITNWYDGMIVPGMPWEQVIATHLDAADIILLLISSDFMNSDYCYSKEMKRALERHEKQEARVVPILLWPVYWSDAPFSHLHVLPVDAKPVIRWNDRDSAFEDITKGILHVAQDLSAHRQLHQVKDDLSSLQHSETLQTPISSVPDSTSSVQKVQNETKIITSREKLRLFPALGGVSEQRVVVVPAKIALDEYLKYSVYFCQPHRSFQPSVRMAFYTHNKIDRHIPKILGYVEDIARDEIESRSDLSEYERTLLRVLRSKLDHARSEKWRKTSDDVYFLTPPDSSETLLLPQDIENDATARSSPTKKVAFTQNQRYLSLALLEKGPRYTSDLGDISSDGNEA